MKTTWETMQFAFAYVTGTVAGGCHWPGRIMDSSQTNAVASVLRIHRRHQDTSTSADEPVDRLVDAVQRASSWSRVIVAVSDLISFIVPHLT